MVKKRGTAQLNVFLTTIEIISIIEPSNSKPAGKECIPTTIIIATPRKKSKYLFLLFIYFNQINTQTIHL